MAMSFDENVVISRTYGFNGGCYSHDLGNWFLMALTFHKRFMVRF